MRGHLLVKDRQKARQVTWLGILINIFLFIVKLFFGFIGQSQAVVADAIHSLSDLTTDFAVLISIKFWEQGPDEDHPYGHGTIESFTTFLIGVILVFVGIGIGYKGLISLKEGVLEVPKWAAFWAAGASIFLKEILYRVTIKVGKKIRSSSVVANAWHHRTDAFSSIPVVIAVFISILKPSWSFLDEICAVFVSVFIVYAGIKILLRAFDEISGKGVGEKQKKKIEKICMNVEGVKAIHALRTRKMGADIFSDIHIQVNEHISVKQGHDISTEVENQIIKKVPQVVDVTVHIEPYEDEHSQDFKYE